MPRGNARTSPQGMIMNALRLFRLTRLPPSNLRSSGLTLHSSKECRLHELNGHLDSCRTLWMITAASRALHGSSNVSLQKHEWQGLIREGRHITPVTLRAQPAQDGPKKHSPHLAKPHPLKASCFQQGQDENIVPMKEENPHMHGPAPASKGHAA